MKKGSCWILLKEWKFWIKTVLWGSHCGHSWPFLSNRRRLCGHQTSFWSHSDIYLALTTGSCWSEVVSVQAGAWIDSKICRSDYETGRWEALKLKPAQMESDACSANRHQPTAGCLKASDLWELDGYGNCCLTDTHSLHEFALVHTHIQVIGSGDCANTQKYICTICNSKAHTSTNSVSSVVRVGSCTLLFAF